MRCATSSATCAPRRRWATVRCWKSPAKAGRTPWPRRVRNCRRVSYVFEDGRLIRLFWDVLDRAPSSEPVVQTLLTDVREAEFVAYDDGGQEHRFWPRSNFDARGELAAIGFNIDTETYGRIERLLLVPTPATDLAEPEASDLDDEDEPDAPAREEPTEPETTEVSAAPRLKRTGAA